MSQNRPLSDYDPTYVPFDQRRSLLKEAVKAGCVYQLLVEGYDKHGEEGSLFYAPNDDEAKRTGYNQASVCSIRMTGLSYGEGCELEPDYVPHSFTIHHVVAVENKQVSVDRIVWRYTPPTPDDIVNGVYFSLKKSSDVAWLFEDQKLPGLALGGR